jgi:GrpB-like predicted nucleotidyltransferase (UPF0157 family)
MAKRLVVVKEYDDKWKVHFTEIKDELENALGKLAVSVEHVGSTSVEGLAAKPIIDIDVVISDYSCFEEVVRKLNEVGYTHEGDLGIKYREAFKYYGKEHLQQHHLYVCPANSRELYRHLTFRDFLRNNPEAVREYGKVKLEAARLFSDDIEKYMEYKAPCIEKLYTQCGLV